MLTFLRKRQLRKKIEQAVADGVLTEQEFREIEQMREELNLPTNYVTEMRKTHFLTIIQPILNQVINTRRYTPEQENKIMKMAQQLRIDANPGVDLAMYRKLWEFENTGHLILEPIPVSIRLSKGEQCYHVASAIWSQQKTVRRHHGYTGASIGLRVAKGVTLRVGRAVPVTSSHEEIVDVADGRLYVTNKKLAFVGQSRSTTITKRRLLDWEVYKDCIMVHKSSGKPDIFKMKLEDIEYINAILQTMEQ